MGPVRLFVFQGPSGSSSEERKLVFPPVGLFRLIPLRRLKPPAFRLICSVNEKSRAATQIFILESRQPTRTRFPPDNCETGVQRLWGGPLPPHPHPHVLGLNITSGTTSKTKSESVSVVHGCQRLKGRPFKRRTVAVARRLWPSIHATAAGMSPRHPCFLTWYPLKNGFPPQCTTMM